MLPGGESEFCNFVSKVIFGGEGAIAGVRVEGEDECERGDDDDEGTGCGVDGGLVLTDLPFQGSVRVERQGCVESGSSVCDTCVLLACCLILYLRVEGVHSMLPGAPASFVCSSAVL